MLKPLIPFRNQFNFFSLSHTDFKRITISKIRLRVNIGDHVLADPQITMRYSHDGGHTWSNHLARSLGSTGEFAKYIEWNRIGAGDEWIFEFTIVEPMSYLIADGIVRVSDVESI